VSICQVTQMVKKRLLTGASGHTAAGFRTAASFLTLSGKTAAVSEADINGLHWGSTIPQATHNPPCVNSCAILGYKLQSTLDRLLNDVTLICSGGHC
jgi:hypothetical protein